MERKSEKSSTPGFTVSGAGRYTGARPKSDIARVIHGTPPNERTRKSGASPTGSKAPAAWYTALRPQSEIARLIHGTPTKVTPRKPGASNVVVVKLGSTLSGAGRYTAPRPLSDIKNVIHGTSPDVRARKNPVESAGSEKAGLAPPSPAETKAGSPFARRAPGLSPHRSLSLPSSNHNKLW